jgi:hypothetical protein
MKTYWIGGWVGPRAILDAVVKRKIPSPRRKSNPRTPIMPIVIYYSLFSLVTANRDSSVGIAMGYWLDDRGSRVGFPAGLGIFLLTTTSRTVVGLTQPHIQWVPGSLPLGVKRPGRETNHSPPSSAEVKECVELYLHSRNTPSWRGAQFKESTGTTSPSTSHWVACTLVCIHAKYINEWSMIVCIYMHEYI